MHSSNGRPRVHGGGPGRPADTRDTATDPSADAPEPMGYDDPWYDALAAGWGESAGPVGAVSPARAEGGRTALAAADVYLEVQRSAAFQEVRSRYRRFVVPAVVAFLAWYLGYVVAATTAPGLMARPVAGAVNVAMLAGLGQFLTTFALTWAYARHARLCRDRAALELRWDTQELTRGVRGGAR
ncbi:DUF485 domain-containing protein [Streptomyces sp. NPDC005017]|uniref:DUF485 domain-containing protein n=1 Tax=Streptomyces sp. NPDC005017 TaxID=3364706 RepID=UPI0036958891